MPYRRKTDHERHIRVEKDMSVAEPGSHAAIQDLKGEESARVALDSNLPNTESIAYPSARQESPLHVRSYRELPPEERTGEPLSGNHALEQEAYNPSPKESIGEDIKSLTGKEVTTSDTTSEGDVLDWEKLNQIEDFKDEPIPSGSAEMKTVAVTKLPDPIEKLQVDNGDDGSVLIQSARFLPAQPVFRHFTSQIRQVCPLINPALILRVAQAQKSRYELRKAAATSHSRDVAHNQCPSGSLCSEKGGKEHSEKKHFSTLPGIGPASSPFPLSKEVTPTLFPLGIPLPPVKWLPARFECPICFKVKVFSTPSDWTSHVHDDLRPYICTFTDCNGPHIFRSKRDWELHDSRHRRSEWFECNLDVCNYSTTRQDSLEAHLRKKHSVSAEKAKHLVQNESFRHGTPWTSQSEPCVFCGSTSGTLIDHVAHLGKHMEQISFWSLPIDLLSHYEPTPLFTKYKLGAENPGNKQPICKINFPQILSSGAMSIDASGTETVTDSGYGSCTQDKPTKQNTDLGQETRLYNEIENTDLENMKPIAGAEIDESVYSSTSSLSDASMSGYVFAIAEEISDAVSGSLVSEEMVDKVCNALPRLLKGLSASIGSNATSQMHLDVMVFLRKYRRNITAICREIITERPSWKSRDDSENMSLTEKMSMWQGIKDEVMEPADHVALEGLDIDSADDDDDDDYDYDDSSLEANLPGFEAYKSLVRSDPSYGKLISDIFRECIVMSTLPNTLEEISNTITRILPASPRISRKVLPERFTMRFQVDWDPVTFLHEQQYSESPDIAIGQAIALTGSTVTVQALRCSEYLQQTWPSSGVNILKLIQEKVRPGYPNKSTGIGILPDETRVMIDMETSNNKTNTSLIVLVNALPGWIVEIGEILSWMGSVLRTSPHSDRLVFCKPSIVNARRGPSVGPNRSDFACTILFTMQIAISDSQVNGQCWHGLFKNPVVAEGFPIARRSSLKMGLEIPLAMMATLAGTSHAHSFSGKLFLKGFSTMLVPTEFEGDLILWHLISSNGGSRISYNDGVGLCNNKIQFADLKGSRHILGWCSTIKFIAGSRDAKYSVETSGLPKASPSCLLANVSISQGRRVTEDAGKISFGLKDFKSGGIRRHYIQKLKSIEKRFVLFWDEEHKRGWLVNGATALLHLVRASLEEDRNGVFSAATIFHPSKMRYPEPYRPYSGSWVLGDNSNTKIPIYDDDNDPVLFHEYVTQFYEILEKAFDYQSAAVSAHPERCSSRSQLEGWDFENLAAERDPIFAKEAKLDPAGRSWIDLIRSVRAITLFGRGFGDMVQPIGACSNWGQVPPGNSYLVICQEDLREIVASWCGNLLSVPPMLTDQIIWHMPEDNSIRCRCISTKNMPHSDIAQALLPSTMAYQVTGETLSFEDNKAGAFIFGLNSSNLWHWPEDGEPSRKPTASIAGIRNDSDIFDSLDSGIGGSCDSRSSTREDSLSRLSAGLRTEPRRSISMASYSTSDSYTVGIICALHIELMAVRILFDSHYDVMVPFTDTNSYAFGSMGQHNIVATCLPDGEYGTNAAASVASNMERTFGSLQFCLLVGIGGGAPSSRNDIRLGDVVVSKPIGSRIGVVPYDMIKAQEHGSELNGYLQPPPRILRSVSSLMQSDPRLSREPLEPYLRQIRDANPDYAHPEAFSDTLYVSGYPHPRGEDTCEKCDTSREQIRPPRPSSQPKIHYGLIASGNQVVKDAKVRDALAEEYGILCFEMEAAGIMNILPSFIIRGICDYADSHKNKNWQNYAAATAAAYTKLLLFHLRRDLESDFLPNTLDRSMTLERFQNGRWLVGGDESFETEGSPGPTKRRRTQG